MELLLPGTVLATFGFLGLHWSVGRISGRSFRTALKLSRGIAATVLVLIGLFAAIEWWELRRVAFLAAQPDPLDAWPVAIFAGHLAADLFWILGGRLVLDSRVARDLVVHHLLGIAVCVAAVWFGAGHALIGVILLAEVLPVMTGLAAWARSHERSGLERNVLRASLWLILLFRIPLWLAVGALLAAVLVGGRAEAIHWAVAPVVLPGLGVVVALDLYWVRSYRRILRAFPHKGVRDLSLDPLAPWTVEGR